MKNKELLAKFEKRLYCFLMKRSVVMPQSFRKFLATYYPDARVRKKYLQLLGVEMGEGSYANMGFIVSPNNTREVHCHIGKNVSIAPNVVCICESNANNGVEINTYPYVKEKLTKLQDIYIEDEVWIGANVTVLPGVKIGKCAVIGAGSVVTCDVDAYGVYAGVPARKIRDIREEEKVHDK